jgi:hypothetical protein
MVANTSIRGLLMSNHQPIPPSALLPVQCVFGSDCPLWTVLVLELAASDFQESGALVCEEVGHPRREIVERFHAAAEHAE